MYLSALIKKLEDQKDHSKIIKNGFHNPHSHRGSYDQLAFEAKNNISIADMLKLAKEANGNTYHGYKGGDYLMGDYSEVYIAEYGSSGYELNEITLNCMLENNLLLPDEIIVKKEKIDAVIQYCKMYNYDVNGQLIQMLEDLKK